jgi:PAS domain S-box-containing protein
VRFDLPRNLPYNVGLHIALAGLPDAQLTDSPQAVSFRIFPHRGLDLTIPLPDQEAREREEHLRLVLDASGTGLWTWDMATDAVTWSPECYRILGIPEGAFAGTGQAFFALLHSGDRQRVEEAVQAAISERRRFVCEFRVLRSGGEPLWVSNRGRALYDGDGRPLRMLGTVTDIHERKRVEEELSFRELELQTLTNNTPDILARFDRQLRHVFVNAAVERATGQPAAEFIGRTNRELGMPEDLCRLWDEALYSVFETGQPRSIEFTFPALSGPQYHSARLVPERSPDGRIDLVLCVTHDMTDRRRVEEALKEQDHRKDMFLATLAHELRNPLAPLRTGLAILRRISQDASAVKTLDMMDRQLAQMVHLVDDLLDIARVSSGKITLRSDRPSIQDLVAAAVEACRPLLQTKGHSLDMDLPSERIEVTGDFTRLVQVLSNLLTNAAKYTDPEGQIRITAECQGSEAVLRVADTGVGLAPETLATVWDMFTQVRDTVDKAQGGLGIGLALVKKLVEMHGGRVEARSPGLGQGSTFTIALPIA